MIGIQQVELSEIRQIILDHAPDCQVLLFGSRARGTHAIGSDLDLAFKRKDNMKLGLERISRLKYEFDESGLPYRVDVLDYWSVTPDFRKIIESGAIDFSTFSDINKLCALK